MSKKRPIRFISQLVTAILLSSLIGIYAYADETKELVFIFQKQKDPNQIKVAAEKVGQYLSKEIGLPVKVQVPSDYSASVQALVSKKADFAYTSSLPFLLAKRDGGAELLLAEERIDPRGNARTDYDAVLVVRKDSPLKSVEDLKKNAKELSFVFTSPTSTSGYVFAYKRLVDEGLLQPKQEPKSVFKNVSFGGSYTQALEQVLKGRSDVAAVSYYTIEGPKASKYLPQESLDRLRILTRTPGVPTHLISARKGLDKGLKKKVKEALLKLGEENSSLLEDVYGTAKFKEVEEGDHLKGTVDAVRYIGLPIEDLS